MRAMRAMSKLHQTGWNVSSRICRVTTGKGGREGGTEGGKEGRSDVGRQVVPWCGALEAVSLT